MRNCSSASSGGWMASTSTVFTSVAVRSKLPTCDRGHEVVIVGRVLVSLVAVAVTMPLVATGRNLRVRISLCRGTRRSRGSALASSPDATVTIGAAAVGSGVDLHEIARRIALPLGRGQRIAPSVTRAVGLWREIGHCDRPIAVHGPLVASFLVHALRDQKHVIGEWRNVRVGCANDLRTVAEQVAVSIRGPHTRELHTETDNPVCLQRSKLRGL